MVIRFEEDARWRWRVELRRETVPLPKAKGGGEWEAWVVRTFEPGGTREHLSDVEWASVRFYENRVDEMRRKYGEGKA